MKPITPKKFLALFTSSIYLILLLLFTDAVFFVSFIALMIAAVVSFVAFVAVILSLRENTWDELRKEMKNFRNTFM